MIMVTRLDNSEFFINADYIQAVESRPDTKITLVNGHTYIVRETDREVVTRVIAYRQAVVSGSASNPPFPYLRLVEG